MRLVIQRVLSASVTVDGEVVGQIGRGLLCLVGVGADDGEADATWCCNKILNTRLWPDERERAWQRSAVQEELEVLLVSQFTLYCTMKGNKPDFHLAMPPAQASDFYAQFVDRVRAAYVPERVHNGVFGAKMEVALVNDGPVTLNLDSAYKGGAAPPRPVQPPAAPAAAGGAAAAPGDGLSKKERKRRAREERKAAEAAAPAPAPAAAPAADGEAPAAAPAADGEAPAPAADGEAQG